MVIEKEWYQMSGTPIKFSRTPGALRYLPPKYGENTRAILAEFGFSEEEIADLLSSNTVLTRRSR